MTPQQAEEFLRTIPGFTWLLENPQIWWKASEVAEGLRLSDNFIIKQIEAGRLPYSVNHGTAGWRIPRDSLLIYCANLAQGGSQSSAS